MHCYTLLIVMLGWVFFRAETLSQATSYIGSLVGAGSGRLDVTDLWNRELLLALMLAVPCCMPILPWLAKRWTENDLAGWRAAGLEFASVGACIALWFVIMPCLCAGSYSPFLYFRF